MKFTAGISGLAVLSMASAAAIDPPYIAGGDGPHAIPSYLSVPPPPPYNACTRNLKSPLTSDCKAAVALLPTRTPVACTMIYKPWHIAATYGSCSIGFWAPGNAHCLPGKQMKDLATKVLKECSGPKGPIGIGGGASVTEGYKSTDEKGHTGVWVFRAEEKDKGKPDVPSPNEPSVPLPEEEAAEEEPSTGEVTPSNSGGIGEGERVVTFE